MSETATTLDLQPATTLSTLAVLSMLSETADRNSATRTFRGRPVIACTLDRVQAIRGIAESVVLTWDDQLLLVTAAVGGRARVRSLGPRRPSAQMRAINAALRWCDGWRGGLLGTCEFDRGFDAPALVRELDDAGADAALLVHPAAALLDVETADRMITNLTDRPHQDYSFTPGAVGSGAMLLRKKTVEELKRAERTPGSLLSYDPDRPMHDPLAKEAAVPASPRLSRSLARLTVDSDRQAHRLSLLTLAGADAAASALDGSNAIDALPREVLVELTTERSTRPAWSMLSRGAIVRPAMSIEHAKRLFAELASADDVRITFGGAGDPLLHPQLDAIVEVARAAGIGAVHVETDLLPDDPSTLLWLASGAVDIVSFHLPSVHQDTYERLMAVDRMKQVLDNVRLLVQERNRLGERVPIIVPTFVKCAANVGEMEQWYDQWIRAVGTAAVVGPSDFAGRIDYLGVSDMTPSTRVPCRRLRSRMTVLSDGTFVSCEEDVLGQLAIGSIDTGSVAAAWGDGLAAIRASHAARQWNQQPLCGACRMSDRP